MLLYCNAVQHNQQQAGKRLKMTPKSDHGIQVIRRSVAILRLLGLSQTFLSLGQIAHRCALPRSTVQRIVATLVDEGLVIANAHGDGFSLGPQAYVLASQQRNEAWRQYQPNLARLASKTGETVDLAVLQKTDMLFIDQVPGSHRLRAVSEPGQRFSALKTANGRACLSMLTNKELTQRFGVDDAFLDMMQEVRDTGLAWDIDEHMLGISAVGAAFKGTDGQLYAISIPVPSQRFNRVKSELAKLLTATLQTVGA